MDINKIIKQNILGIDAQLNVDLNAQCLKPMVFIDNTNFNAQENSLAIVHLELFDSKDVVVLNSKVETNDAFTVTNLLGDETVYCFWGEENKDIVISSLENWGYPISNKTQFIDLREEANRFYNDNIVTFDDIQTRISYAVESMDLIFSSKESVMYSLFVNMYNDGYTNELCNSSLRDVVMKNDLANMDNIFKGAEFRNGKSNIELETEELNNFEQFVNAMIQYNEELIQFIESKIKNTQLDEIYKLLLSEKVTTCRFKKDSYVYTKALLDIYKKEDFDTYKFFYKTIDMYAMIEDAFILSQSLVDEDGTFRDFVTNLGSSFGMSQAAYAQTYMLRKNIIAKLNK